jgi:endonuclease V-like protein UPF0215 family
LAASYAGFVAVDANVKQNLTRTPVLVVVVMMVPPSMRALS